MFTTIIVLIRLLLTLAVVGVPISLLFSKIIIPGIRDARLRDISLIDDGPASERIEHFKENEENTKLIEGVNVEEEEEEKTIPFTPLTPHGQRELNKKVEVEVEDKAIKTEPKVISTHTETKPESELKAEPKLVSKPKLESKPKTKVTVNTDKKPTPPTIAELEQVSPASIATNREKHLQAIERIKFSALSYRERGKIEKYEKKLIEGLAFAPEHDEFLEMLSSHYFQQGSEVKALSLLKRVIAMNPENHKSIRQVAQIYRNQKKDDAARILIEKAIMLKPDNPKYLISLVELHYDNNELREAVGVMETLMRLRPNNTDYVLTLATLHEELHQPTDAQKYFMKVLEIDPHNEYAKKGLKRVTG